MIDKLEFGEFIASVHYSSKDEVFFGKLEGVNDLVTFEGATVAELKKAFRESVKEYVELCKETGKEALKSFKGSFNVRVDPDLHKLAFKKATREGKSLNQLVQHALEKEVLASADGKLKRSTVAAARTKRRVNK